MKMFISTYGSSMWSFKEASRIWEEFISYLTTLGALLYNQIKDNCDEQT
jgi:hypothetical protein